MEDQIKPFTCRYLNPLLCGFREKHSTQHALLRFVETCKRALEKGDSTGAVFFDLSKAFDCLNHDLSIAKLEAYGFSKASLKLIHSYLQARRQWVKVNGTHSSWRERERERERESNLHLHICNSKTGIFATPLAHLQQ